MASTRIQGELEIDHDRGVIYFHSVKSGTSVLRICGLPKPIPNDKDLLDINLEHAVCSWVEA